MPISSKLRFDIFKRDNFTCQYCGKRTPEVILEIDHVIPKSKGGSDEPENLITSCFECNRGKGAGLLEAVLLRKDIHDETILLAERELQLQEYNRIREKIRERENTEIKFLAEHFSNQFRYPEYAQNEFPCQIVREALKTMSYVDIMDYIDYAVRKIERDQQGDDYPNVAAAKYLSGILHNKIKEREDKNKPSRP